MSFSVVGVRDMVEREALSMDASSEARYRRVHFQQGCNGQRAIGHDSEQRPADLAAQREQRQRRVGPRDQKVDRAVIEHVKDAFRSAAKRVIERRADVEQNEHRAEVPSVEDGGVAEQHEDRADARRGDDDRLDDLEDEVEPVLELVLKLGPEEQAQQAQVAHH